MRGAEALLVDIDFRSGGRVSILGVARDLRLPTTSAVDPRRVPGDCGRRSDASLVFVCGGCTLLQQRA